MTAPLIPGRFTRGRPTYERIGRRHAEDLAALMAEPLVLRTLWRA